MTFRRRKATRGYWRIEIFHSVCTACQCLARTAEFALVAQNRVWRLRFALKKPRL